MTKPITVRISHAKLASLEHEVHIGNYVIRELRAAGIPVKGNLLLVLPETGSITVENDDLAADEYIWTWRP